MGGKRIRRIRQLGGIAAPRRGAWSGSRDQPRLAGGRALRASSGRCVAMAMRCVA
jgi:hypothetical protein